MLLSVDPMITQLCSTNDRYAIRGDEWINSLLKVKQNKRKVRSWWTLLFVVAIVLLLLCRSNGLGIAVFRGGVDQRRRFQSNTILRACAFGLHFGRRNYASPDLFQSWCSLSVVRVSSRDV